MAYDDHGGRQRQQFALQPFNGGHVQMVGGFVQQKQVWLGRKCAGQRAAAGFTARQRGRVFRAVQPQFGQKQFGAVFRVARSHARADIIQRGGEARQVGFLRQVAHGGAGLDENGAVIGLYLTRGNAQKGGLAAAIAPDKADALARANAEARAIEQRRAAKGQGNILKEKKGR
ncbi:hypothetical protein GLUCOINTEAF2_0202783 [Komagataeibacter intermedius AF2]|uniref:Uncharacterized protein n=1 Tax=Komagataeibacter intermedius AF2 TaxID=1458464 RepID=A0A0N1FKG9_9PROT|nr:hypothetical protein GLUCOINTEAF2_0202783 [Komagataeibacter intermedius AF2]